MAMLRCRLLAAGVVGLVLVISGGGALAADSAVGRTPYDTRFFTDFDTDGDPWTLQSFADSDSARWFDLILETPIEAPLGIWYWAILLEQHCVYYDPELGEYVCWYGCYVVEMQWDSTYVTAGSLNHHAPPSCNWNGLGFTIREDAPMVGGHRYVIGRGRAVPDCGPPPAESEFCTGDARTFRIWFKAIDKYTNAMTLGCPGAGAAGEVEAGGVGLESVRANPVRDRLALTVRLEPGAPTSVTVHDVAGRLLCRLYEGDAGSGSRSLEWDLRSDATGRRVGSGVYFVRLESPRGRQERSFLILR
jgi:hypothetical protein